jgi:IS30 family transposase
MRPAEDGVYDAGPAHARAREQARRVRCGIFARDAALRAIVQTKLQLQWSPEQIAAWLQAERPARPEWHVCHETIYQGLYFGGSRGLTEELARNLSTGRGCACGCAELKGAGPGSVRTRGPSTSAPRWRWPVSALATSKAT